MPGLLDDVLRLQNRSALTPTLPRLRLFHLSPVPPPRPQIRRDSSPTAFTSHGMVRPECAFVMESSMLRSAENAMTARRGGGHPKRAFTTQGCNQIVTDLSLAAGIHQCYSGQLRFAIIVAKPLC